QRCTAHGTGAWWRPGVSDRNWFLGRRSWSGEEAIDHADGLLRNLSWNWSGGIAANLSDVRRNRIDAASRGQDALQRPMHALRRNRQVADGLQNLRRRGARAAHRND